MRADASASSTPRLPETIAEALDTVEAHFASRGADLYAATPEVTAAVRTMVASKRVDGKTLSEVLDASDGVWEVFDMPHMKKLSSPARVGFKPVRYTLSNRKLRSDVRFKVPSEQGVMDGAGFGGHGSAPRGGPRYPPSATTPWSYFFRVSGWRATARRRAIRRARRCGRPRRD